MAITDHYDIVIGLEVHAQMKTQSKLFCGCRNRFGDEPNENTCPVCLGMPGSLPVPNQEAFDLAIKAALAVGAQIAPTTKFDRKNYFYPDLPKGYQISQYDEPYCTGGGVEIHDESGEKKFIELNRIHMEEDAGKMSHSEDSHMDDSLVDLNRAGTPLLEIVTDPVIYTPKDAYAYLNELKQILLYAEISDCNMQEGSLRCDANISLKPKGSETLGTKVEIKNMNSFKGVQAALESEIKRQYLELSEGHEIVQETRLYDVDRDVTTRMRGKEEADDYRYFPDPDLPRYEISKDWIDRIQQTLPELPRQRQSRMKKEYGIPDYDISELISDKSLADYFEATAKLQKSYKEISNWIMGEIRREMSERKVEIADFEITPEKLAGMLDCIDQGKLNKKLAKEEVFPEMIKSGETAEAVIQRLGIEVKSDDAELQPIVDEAIASLPKIVEDIKNGKGKAIGALVGFCMKKTQGKADPQTINKLLKEALSKLD